MGLTKAAAMTDKSERTDAYGLGLLGAVLAPLAYSFLVQSRERSGWCLIGVLLLASRHDD